MELSKENEMNETHCSELFAGRLKGDLDPDDNLRLDRHLGYCESCQLQFREMRQLWLEMQVLEIPEPGPEMNERFDQLLGDFIAKEKKETGFRTRLETLLAWKPQLTFAAQLFLLFLAFSGGYLLVRYGKSEQRDQLARLNGEVQELKRTMLLAMLENPSASERIKAVTITNEIGRADKKVITALLSVLDNDPNVNVRLSTLDALTGLAKEPEVRQGLVRSIARQDSPMMQLAIAETMLRIQEPASVKPLKELMKKEGLDEEVREKIGDAINRLL